MAKTAKAGARPVVVRVGTVRISDKVTVEAAPRAAQVTVHAGQPFVLEVPYLLQEASDDKEAYVFSLQCTVIDTSTPYSPTSRQPVIDQWEDRWGRKDERKGFLRDEIVLPASGEYSVEYTIEATYTRAAWGKGRVASRDARKDAGSVRVVVGAAR